MKMLILVLLGLSHTVFAGTMDELFHTNKIAYEEVYQLENLQDVEAENTCLDEYLIARQNHIKKALTLPLFLTVGIPAGYLAGGSLGLLSGLMVGAHGSVLVGGSAGALGGFVTAGAATGISAAVLIVLGYETFRLVKLVQMNNMIALLASTKLFLSGIETPPFLNFYQSLKTYKTSLEIANSLIALDTSGKLCQDDLMIRKKLRKTIVQ